MNAISNQKEEQQLLEAATQFTLELTAIPSISGDELAASEYCYKRFCELPGIVVEKQLLDDSIMQDPKWNSGPYPCKGYTGHFNVIATWKGTGKRPPVYLNAHMDTVAPCVPELMPPRLDDGVVYGLGAHDDKGHVAVIHALFSQLSQEHMELPFDVIAHIVVEEENGGNGTLAAVRQAEKGQAAIILDGCDGVIANACRGALWPRITCYGDSCHPSDRQRVKFSNAYALLQAALEAMNRFHEEYCAEIAENPVPYFEDMVPPLNVGSIHAGNWPSTIPTEAVADMVFGVFPGHNNAELRARISAALESDPALKGRYKLEFIFDVDAGVTDLADPLVQTLGAAMIHAGFTGEVKAFNGACDIGFYRNLMGIPAVNVGIGAPNAHSRHECIDTRDIVKLSAAILRWLRHRAEV